MKDLSKIDRDPKDLLILDNSPNSYLFQPESALPIVSWYDDMSDALLYEYVPILQGLSIVDDVRDALETFVYPNEFNEYDRVDLKKAIEILNPYIIEARENLIPEYESRHRTRVFSEPRQFQKPHLDEIDDDLKEEKTFVSETTSFQVHNSAIVKKNTNFGKDMSFDNNEDSNFINNLYNTNSSFPSAKGDISSPLMNTWTNNKFINSKGTDSNPKRRKINMRPRSGNPSPTKMEPGVEKFGNSKFFMNYNSRQNQIYNPRQMGMSSNDAVILRSYSNTQQNITPGSIQSQLQSNNPPQPHQRHIKKAMMGNKHNNLTNDMYKIYGITKNEFGAGSYAPTPKTSSGKRDTSTTFNSFGLRMNNNQAPPGRMNQNTSHGNRSVSPNRIMIGENDKDSESFVLQRNNAIDVLKFQARTNLK